MEKKLSSVKVRELQRYTEQELQILFNRSADETSHLIGKLREYNILKAVPADPEKKDLTELEEDSILDAPVDLESNEKYYVFDYVGLIALAGLIIESHPKYMTSTDNRNQELKQVIRVIRKCNNRRQNFRLFYEGGRDISFNLLSIAVFFLDDYFENGPYTNSQKITEINGTGEINWDLTINDGFAIIRENRPYYPELYTRKTVEDDFDFFKRLHEAILTEISESLRESDVAELLEIALVDLSDERPDDFGDRDYILGRIEKELNIQFNTRKQLLLKAMYTYIKAERSVYDRDNISFVGTNSFNLVWETVCQNILRDQLKKNLKKLKLPVKLAEKYRDFDSLLGIIDRPVWELKSGEKTVKKEAETLKPDLASIDSDNSLFLIFDAKYYVINISPSGAVSGNPGVEDVTKQYLYQLAYKEFTREHRLTNVRNCFLMPTEKEDVIPYGSVHMKMLDDLGLQRILVRLIPAKRAYWLYLTGKQMDVSELELDLEEAAEETGDEDIFYEYSEDPNLIPLYESLAAAGPNYDLGLGDKVCKWIKKPEAYPLSRADFAVTITGSSMEPEISDEEIIYVDSSVRKELRNGDIGIFTVNGSEVCKVLYRDREGNVNLLSLNPEEEYSNIYLDRYSQEEFIVRGKVLGKSGYIPEYFKR